ncbi:MAG: type II toxin-antitoxin system VapC family toxin [Acidimicrobiales bacterium]
MIIVDANVCIYAVNESMAQHVGAHKWMEKALNGREPIGFAWVVLLAFLRISTLVALSPQPLGVRDAWNIIDEWLGAPAATVVAPTTRHSSVLRGLLTEIGVGGNLVNDAHLASLAIEYGAQIASFDRDFNRFGGVRSFVPG